ncbi:MAG: response regulator transcription factor [Gammaproteobacteria bacterium]|nr:response regulator transcription factor [Gammaproteobacteria bacterium]
MKIVIADDEAPARARLAALVAAEGDAHEVVAQAANGGEVLAACERHQVDLVLLDIRMPGMDGIQAALALASRPEPPAVIFITAYDEHALAAFEANAIDYLLKPVRPDRLRRALGKARALSGEQQRALGDSGAYLSVTYRGGSQRIPACDVLFLRADSKYVEVWHSKGMALTEESLRAIEERLPGLFMRVHRNALVAPDCVRGIRRGDAGQILVELEGTEETVEVSRRHAPDLRRLLRGAD